MASAAAVLPPSNPTSPIPSAADLNTVVSASAGSGPAATFNLNATTGSDFLPARTTGTSGIDTTTSYEQSRRQVSSVVISEQLLTEPPQGGGVKYVEVPVVEEVVRKVPGARQVVEKIVEVPRIEYEWIERQVEKPEIRYVDRFVEVEKIEEVLKTIPIRQVQERPVEVVKTVPKVEYRRVEKVVEVPGEVIERQQRVVVENPVQVKRFVDRNEPVVVAQTICPVVTESAEVIDVDVYEYEPQVIPIDVHVAKPIPSHLTAIGATSEIHQHVTVPAAQYNTLLRQLNLHLANEADSLPYIRPDGSYVPFLNPSETPAPVGPNPSAIIHPPHTVDVTRPLSATSTMRSIGQVATTTHTRGASMMIQPTASSVASAQQRAIGSTADLYQTDIQQRSMSQAAIQQQQQTRMTHGGSIAVPTYPQLPLSVQQQTAGSVKATRDGASLYSTSVKAGHRPSRPSHVPQSAVNGKGSGPRRYTGQAYVDTAPHKRRPCEC